MRSKSATASLVSSPVLVGAVTVMVTLVAVFLAYNANEGLPFVPTYDIKALVPNAGGVTKDNEVRIGGSRVGVVKKITAQPTPSGAVGVLHMTLDKRLSLRDDTALTIRPRSPLGLRYIQVVPGTKGKLVPQNGTLPLRDAQPNVDLDQVQNTLDAPTRQALQDALGDLGPGLAGRGIDFNAFVAQSPGLFKGLEDVARNLADPATGLDGFVKGAARAVDEVAPVSSQLADTVTSANVTAGALAGVKTQLGDVIAQSPGTESTATSALAAARPVLRDTHGFLHDLAPGARALPAAAARLHSALARGIPVLGRTPGFLDRLDDTVAAVDELARDPDTPDSVRRLLTTLQAAGPLVQFLAPSQLVCNYIGIYWRNIASSLSEGDASGTWLRTLPIGGDTQAFADATPAPDLHFNPYPNTAAPGETHECEAGNEPFKPGQAIGHAAGDQGTKTEDTAPPAGVGKR